MILTAALRDSLLTERTSRYSHVSLQFEEGRVDISRQVWCVIIGDKTSAALAFKVVWRRCSVRLPSTLCSDDICRSGEGGVAGYKERHFFRSVSSPVIGVRAEDGYWFRSVKGKNRGA